MNIFKKIYYRIYQFIFYVAIPFLPYRKPIIIENEENIIPILKEKNIKNLYLITDQGITQSGLVNILLNKLSDQDLNIVVFDKTIPNPTIENVEEARKIYLDSNLEGIIALGGGSVIDLAKIVGARIACPKKSVQEMKGLLKIRKKTPLLIAIPTTSGTGSEVTLAAVITDNQTHHKYPINDFSLIPHYAVLDYTNTLKLPKSITATTGMDALTHAIEAYIGNSRTRETKKMSLEATKLIVNNLKTCYFEPLNIEARKNMLYASHYAGIAFTKAYVGYVHAIAHTLGGKYNIPHGLANAIILPIMLEEYGTKIHKKLKELAVYSSIAEKQDTEKVASEKFIKWIYDINKEMEISTFISEIKEEDLEDLINYALKEGNPLYPVPVLMDKKDFRRIYLRIKNNNK